MVLKRYETINNFGLPFSDDCEGFEGVGTTFSNTWLVRGPGFITEIPVLISWRIASSCAIVSRNSLWTCNKLLPTQTPSIMWRNPIENQKILHEPLIVLSPTVSIWFCHSRTPIQCASIGFPWNPNHHKRCPVLLLISTLKHFSPVCFDRISMKP